MSIFYKPEIYMLPEYKRPGYLSPIQPNIYVQLKNNMKEIQIQSQQSLTPIERKPIVNNGFTVR